nr:DUF3793 family protein [Clostridium putrefaciens]
MKLDYFRSGKKKGVSVIMIYNRSKLEGVIYNEEGLESLLQYGYNKDMKLNEVLFKLKQRFAFVCLHEIGLPLGYPIYYVVMNLNKK